MEAISGVPTWLLVGGMLAAMSAANEAGYRLGVRLHRRESEPSRATSNALKGSVLGLVALLLGFSFSMTAGRHDQRRRVVLDEANALGTCYLRAGLLPDTDRETIRGCVRAYVVARLAYYEQGLDPDSARVLQAAMAGILDELWRMVEAANRTNPDAVRNSLIVPAANDVIDLNGTRDWAVRGHLPLPVLLLLAACVTVASLLMGHSSGQAGARHLGHWAALNVLLVLVLFVVLDFDRPRRGLIQIDHTPLTDLRAATQPTIPPEAPST